MIAGKMLRGTQQDTVIEEEVEMWKRMNKVGLVVAGLVMLMGSFYLAQAAGEFACTVESNNIMLKSGGGDFLILKNHGSSFLQIENVNIFGWIGGKLPWLNRDTIKKAEVILDTAEKKVVYLSFQHEKKFQVQLNLEIKKDLPCIFVSSRILNISDEPQKASCSFYVRRVSYYTKGKDLLMEKVPEKSDTLFGMFNRVLLSWPEKSVGVISLNANRLIGGSSKNIHFVNEHGLLEEGQIGFSQQFILSPAKTIEGLNFLYERIKKEGIRHSHFMTANEISLL